MSRRAGAALLAFVAEMVQVRGMRTCGECSACCTAFDVGALEKPAGAPCPHLQAERGCGIYRERPDACRAFACGWLTDATWTDGERPDHLGVIVVAADPGSAFARSAGVACLVAYELRPRALDSGEAQRLLTRLSRRGLVALVRHGWERRDREPSGFTGLGAPSGPVRQVIRSALARSADGANGDGVANNDKRKQSLYFPEDMLAEIQSEANRQDRSLSWIVQRAWQLARGEIARIPGMDDLASSSAAKAGGDGVPPRR